MLEMHWKNHSTLSQCVVSTQLEALSFNCVKTLPELCLVWSPLYLEKKLRD